MVTRLDIGDPSPCSESGDKDWFVEGRALVGKDFIGRRWGWSPEAGLGVRHLSNGTTGTAGYRTDDYLYLPIGITARTIVASHNALSFNLEYDHLLHGWQKTRDSQWAVEMCRRHRLRPHSRSKDSPISRSISTQDGRCAQARNTR
jgi:hypothetical protein